jgi:hypothetical protein
MLKSLGIVPKIPKYLAIRQFERRAMAPLHLLVVGLGNMPYPNTRHRHVQRV